jgi:hypothetical protein
VEEQDNQEGDEINIDVTPVNKTLKYLNNDYNESQDQVKNGNNDTKSNKKIHASIDRRIFDVNNKGRASNNVSITSHHSESRAKTKDERLTEKGFDTQIVNLNVFISE